MHIVHEMTIHAMQAVNLDPPERQASGGSQPAQQRPGLTDIQKGNLQQVLHTVSELAPGKRPDQMLLSFIMSKTEPMDLGSIKGTVEAWCQQLDQQALQQHRQQLLLQQHQQRLQQQQQQQGQGQSPGVTATGPLKTSSVSQHQDRAIATPKDLHEALTQQSSDQQEQSGSSDMGSDVGQSSEEESREPHTDSAQHSYGTAGGHQRVSAHQPEGQQPRDLSAQSEGHQRALSQQPSRRQLSSLHQADAQQRSLSHAHIGGQQRLNPKNIAPSHPPDPGLFQQKHLVLGQQRESLSLPLDSQADHEQQQQHRQGQLQQQGSYSQSALAGQQDGNPMLQVGMPNWQQRMLQQAHTQQLALSQQATQGATGGPTLADMLQRVQASAAHPPGQTLSQGGQPQQQQAEQAQPEQLEADGFQGAQAPTAAPLLLGTPPDSPFAGMQMQSSSLQRDGSLVRGESSGRVSLEPSEQSRQSSPDERRQSQWLQMHQLHGQRTPVPKLQDGQHMGHQGKLQGNSQQLDKMGQQGHMQQPHVKQGHSQKSQERPLSQLPLSADQSPQLSHLARSVPMSHHQPSHPSEAVRSELQSIQQRLLAQSRSRSTEPAKQVCSF